MATIFRRLKAIGAGLTLALLAGVMTAPLATGAHAETITVASTTSTENSGLFKFLLPAFEKDTGVQVKVIAVGTGQALDIGRRGDADVLFVHDPAAEQKFVDEGYGIDHQRVMYNDFIIVGPKSDPAKVRGDRDVIDALRKIAAADQPFASRGDRSGTHMAELRYWKEAGIDVTAARGKWYKETGSGMGPTLNTASGMNAYSLTDRGTWLSFKNRGELEILVEGDQRLFNQYGVMLVNPARHPQVKVQAGRSFMDWLVSPKGQQTIADYQVNGQQLFFPNAGK